MRVLIIAAGEASRWDCHLGVPKHLAPLLGETLLARNVRLIHETRPGCDVRVVVRDVADTRYRLAGARLEAARLDPALGDADKFLSSEHLWHPGDRTVILYGDTFITRAAMDRILSARHLRAGWHVVVRFGAGSLTGTEWGENLAHVIDPCAHDAYRANLRTLVALQADGEIYRSGGWEQYALMAGGDLANPAVDLGNATDIDDWSDDFDYPADYDRWCQRYAAAPRALQALAE